MAAKSFTCRLITPVAHLLDDAVTYVQAPLWDGQAGVLPGRAPIMAKLGLGELRLDFLEGGSRSYLVEGGFAQMAGERLTILAELAIPVEELSESEARAELAEAEARTPADQADAERVSKDKRRARLKITLAERFKAAGAGI